MPVERQCRLLVNCRPDAVGSRLQAGDKCPNLCGACGRPTHWPDAHRTAAVRTARRPDGIVAALDDPRVGEFIGGPDVTTPAALLDRIEQPHLGRQAPRGARSPATVDPADARPLDDCSTPSTSPRPRLGSVRSDRTTRVTSSSFDDEFGRNCWCGAGNRWSVSSYTVEGK